MQPMLHVFAKQPLPGQVKTRLHTHCTPAQAAGIAATLIVVTVERVVAAWPGPVALCGWPNSHHALFVALARRHGVELVDQAPGDLGVKMLAVLQAGIDRCGAAAVMGCDVPHVTREVLASAGGQLVRRRNVLGCATDGGFYFIGLCHASPRMFDGVAWGGSRVAAQTITAARAAGIEFHAMLAELRDIDTWEDFLLVAEQLPALRAYVP